MRRFLDWLASFYGGHVCNEFTRYEIREENFTRQTSVEKDGTLALKTDEIEFTRRWQERQCTICGVMQQRRLEF